MDALILMIIALAGLLSWLIAIKSEDTYPLLRVVGALAGVPTTLWFFFSVLAQTNSMVHNEIQTGPVTLALTVLGFIAAMGKIDDHRRNHQEELS